LQNLTHFSQLDVACPPPIPPFPLQSCGLVSRPRASSRPRRVHGSPRRKKHAGLHAAWSALFCVTIRVLACCIRISEQCSGRLPRRSPVRAATPDRPEPVTRNLRGRLTSSKLLRPPHHEKRLSQRNASRSYPLTPAWSRRVSRACRLHRNGNR